MTNGELVWEPASRGFHFSNCLTSEKRLIMDKHIHSIHDDDSQAAQGLFPSQGLKQNALKAALEGGYSQGVVSQILEYDVDLDDAILGCTKKDKSLDFPGSTYFNYAWLTPLEWAVDSGNVGLVELFLQNDADADFSTYKREGPALVRAVKKRNQKLIEMLLPRSSRVSLTRALRHAVEQQDIAIISTLLMNGVIPDFEESDRPQPYVPSYDGCCFPPLNQGPSLQAEDFTPPLVRATRLGNASMVRLLRKRC